MVKKKVKKGTIQKKTKSKKSISTKIKPKATPKKNPKLMKVLKKSSVDVSKPKKKKVQVLSSEPFPHLDNIKASKRKEDVKICDIDKDGYISVNLVTDKLAKGLRVKFSRTKGRTKKTIGLQIEK